MRQELERFSLAILDYPISCRDIIPRRRDVRIRLPNHCQNKVRELGNDVSVAMSELAAIKQKDVPSLFRE